MKDQGEQKTLPPTPKKLRDARKKGQTARSKDMTVAVATVVATLYLWIEWGAIRQSLQDIIDLVPALYDRPFDAAAASLGKAMLVVAARTTGPLFAVVAAATIAASAVVTRGFVFSLQSIAPKAENINPIEGFKKLFSLKNLIELIKSIAKTALMAAAFSAIIATGLGMLLKSAACGLDCVSAAFATLVKSMMIASAVLFLAAGLADALLQNFLFRREMRMTLTELKREQKDDMGDPHIRRARKREQREMAQGGNRVGVRHATVVVSGGGTVAVGLQFIRGKTPLPVIVCKGRDERARMLLASARDQKTPVYEDPELAGRLADKIAVGKYITQDLFQPVARALARAGAV